MLAKDFIISFKLFLRAFIFFTNKKDRDLRLCVNYCSLKAITKKNKYLLLLVRILLNSFTGLKHYIKLDIIAAFNALHIQARNK